MIAVGWAYCADGRGGVVGGGQVWSAPAMGREPSKADLAVVDARVWTGDPDRPAADAVATRGDRVVAIGREQVDELIGPGTRVVQAGGAQVLPGFQDAHVHAPVAGRQLNRLWLNDTVERQGYLDAVAAYAAANPDEPWIIGGGWAMEYFPGGTPRKEDLDAIVSDRPVFLMNRDVHGAWVNSKALEIAGIDRDTPDPPDGRIERDPATGEPTGTLHEGAAYDYETRLVPTPDRAGWEAGDPRVAGAPARARHHRLAGRLGDPGDDGGLHVAGRQRAAHRPGGRGTVVGPAPRPRADRRAAHPA